MASKQVAVVTGGSSGLGLSVAERFARKGITVAMVDIAAESGKQQAARLREEGDDVHFFTADVANQNNAKEVIAQVVQSLGAVHVLVNAAGIIRRSPNVLVPDHELKAVLDVNLNGTVYMCQAAQPHMAVGGGGAIVNFASMLAHYGSKNLLSYAASKGGIVQITKCLAVDWAEYHIRVNAVSPGYIETPLSSGATRDPAFKERILSRTPQRRFGTPAEVAAAIDFLCSDDASFITGVVLPVDGGLLAGDPSLFPPA
ncbi:SDR family NAD(P)-dependent oxidoreductase [Paenibacillus piri]|uniref:SDR family oxidoreductase n=1 Tax=Paenibacillus piri TaxID=2547395 RepID=A0A4R5KD88_9BACL|nr:SDR family oxidoreductase [Paenibacillus piri]TDF93173.1 SDR family oxidoreductase [Paenibacillus piri]